MLLLLKAELLLRRHVRIWLDGRAGGDVCGLLGVWVYDDDVTFLEVVNESMKISQIKTTAGVIPTLRMQVSR